MAALGAGIALDGDHAPPEAIGEAVMRVLAEPTYAGAARRMAAEIAEANAPATAVAWLEALVTSRRCDGGACLARV